MYTAIIEADNDLLRFIIQQNLIPADPTGIIITLHRKRFYRSYSYLVINCICK